MLQHWKVYNQQGVGGVEAGEADVSAGKKTGRPLQKLYFYLLFLLLIITEELSSENQLVI